MLATFVLQFAHHLDTIDRRLGRFGFHHHGHMYIDHMQVSDYLSSLLSLLLLL